MNASLSPALRPPYLTVDLPAGSLVVERYVTTNRRGNNSRVQWLAEVVDKDGNLLLMKVCKTRSEAVKALADV